MCNTIYIFIFCVQNLSVETGFKTSTLAVVLIVDVSNRSVSACSANKHPLVAWSAADYLSISVPAYHLAKLCRLPQQILFDKSSGGLGSRRIIQTLMRMAEWITIIQIYEIQGGSLFPTPA